MGNPGNVGSCRVGVALVLVSPSGDLLEEVSRVSLGPCQIRDQPPASLLELPLFF